MRSIGPPEWIYGCRARMIAVTSVWQTFRRGFPIYAWPILAATMIFVDWNHTREWKAAGRISALEKEILGKQSS